MKVKIKRLNDRATLPTYAKPGDAGMDLTAIYVNHGEHYIEYGFGISVEIPEGYMGLLFPRSSNCNKDLLLANSVGVVDSSYRGELKARFKRILNPINHSTDGDMAVITASCFEEIYAPGDRVAQLIVVPYPSIEWDEVEELETSERGEKGFGSSGN